MSERLKRILLILGFITVCVGLGVLIYYVFFREPSSTSQPSVTQSPGGRLPLAGNSSGSTTGVIFGEEETLPVSNNRPPSLTLPVPPTPDSLPRTRIMSESVTRALSRSSNDTQGIRFYNPLDGRFYRITDEGIQIPLSDQTFFNVDSVSWGKASDKAVLTFPDGTKILYDFSNNRQATLPKHWEDFDFSPNDERIVSKSIGNNEDNRFLVIANPDGTGARAIEELGSSQDKVHVSWSPNNQIIAYGFTGEPLSADRQAVVLVGQNHENFKNLIVEGRGFIPNWSPSGQNILYSVYSGNDGYRPTLWVSGAAGDTINANRRNLSLQTWADKCAWQSDYILYCAVPANLSEGAGLQRNLFTNTQDYIYKVDIRSGSLTNLGQPDGTPSVNQLIVGPDNRALFFNDQSTGKLIRFALE